MIKYQILDNFLSEQDYDNLYNLIFKPNGDSLLQFVYVSKVNGDSKTDQFAFGRLFVEYKEPRFDGALDYIDPIMLELRKRLNCGLQVSRAKANLFTRTSENDGLGMHYDLNDNPDYDTIIFYLNDNNGGTRLGDGTFIQQKKNRALIIEGRVLHESVTQTDTNIRVNININYWKTN
jgi:hypothetical protein